MDPLNRFSKMIKQVSSKRNKTDADYGELARLEWYAGLYTQDGKPCIPGEVLEAAFCNGAKRNKLGKQSQAGIICPKNYVLVHPDPQDLDDMWNDGSFKFTVGVRVKSERIMRTRPIFRERGTEFELEFDDRLLNERQIRDIVRITGEEIGLMDWRPKFGRYVVV